MEPFRVLLRVCECDDADATSSVLLEALREAVPVRSALRVRARDGTLLSRHPADAQVSPELVQAATRTLHPEIFPLGSQFPREAADYPAAEMLLLPLRHRAVRETLVLITDEGALGEDILVWEELARGMEALYERCARLAEAQRERDELTSRAEESEALHTLGLAANRTLDQDEVLSLVARFTRTLLGAHYATVHTRDGERVQLVASVGLSDRMPDGDDDALARRVVEIERPVVVGGPEGENEPQAFPFHSAQDMRAGLGVPLALYGDTFGALVVGYRREYEVTPKDVRLALTLAGHAAVAISNAHLHRRLEQHAHELDEAYRQLHQATQAKERFFNAMAHELRTPVTAIRGYIDLLLMGTTGSLSEQAEHYLRRSHRASETLLTLVSDLLDLAKLAAGKLEPVQAEWELVEIVEDALAAVRPQAEQKQLELRGPGAALPTLITDGRLLRQILVNLLSNAVKFTERGSVSLEADTPPDADVVVLRVRDTGRGIPPEDVDRIFEEFEQVAGSEGTGLGLPISRKLAQLLGGELTVESEPGSGSTFELRLPRGEPSGSRASPRQRESVPDASSVG